MIEGPVGNRHVYPSNKHMHCQISRRVSHVQISHSAPEEYAMLANSNLKAFSKAVAGFPWCLLCCHQLCLTTMTFACHLYMNWELVSMLTICVPVTYMVCLFMDVFHPKMPPLGHCRWKHHRSRHTHSSYTTRNNCSAFNLPVFHKIFEYFFKNSYESIKYVEEHFLNP